MENISKTEIINSGYDWTDTDKRKLMLESLLTLLNIAAIRDLGPKPEDFNSNGYQRPKTTEYLNNDRQKK